MAESKANAAINAMAQRTFDGLERDMTLILDAPKIVVKMFASRLLDFVESVRRR